MKFNLLIKKFLVCILSCIMVFAALTPTAFALLLPEMFGNSEPPLCVAAAEGNLEEVQRLLTNGADVNCTGYFHYTPLHVAVTGNYLEIVEYLVTYVHANVDCRDEIGRTPLFLAAGNGYLEIVRYLAE